MPGDRATGYTLPTGKIKHINMVLVKSAGKEKYDAVIIGVGQAGNPLAHSLVEKNYHIAVVEKNLEGGSCINYGCTPSKAMISSAQTAYTLKKSQQWGIHSSITDIDFKQICQRRDQIVRSFRDKTTEFLESHENIDFFRGTASFAGGRKIQISLSGGEKTEITADKIFINTGTKPRIEEYRGLNQIQYYHSKNWVDIRELPESILIVGGGYIGTEMAQMFRRFGSGVTILQDSGQILTHEDRDISEELQNILRDESIEILLNATLQSVRKIDNKYLEADISGRSDDIKKKFSHILIATGTIPATDELKPEAAGIKTDNHGFIIVNDKLETSVKDIYAMGDCKGGPEFTHISYDDFRIINDHLFGSGKKSLKGRPCTIHSFYRSGAWTDRSE